MGLRLAPRPAKPRDQQQMRLHFHRIDCDRPAGELDRGIVLFQPEKRERLVRIPEVERRIVRTQPNRLVGIFEALFEFAEARVPL